MEAHASAGGLLLAPTSPSRGSGTAHVALDLYRAPHNPLSMAIAIASGASPAAGLTTAIVGGFIISALGGSRYQIGGPAGAFIVPPMVTYYFGPRSLNDLNDFCIGKVLDCLRLEHRLYRRWGEERA